MPGMDGYATMRQIRSRAEFRSLPIIAVTGKVVADEGRRCLEAGANEYVPKPVDTADLLAAIQAHFSPGSDCVSAQVSAQFKANAGLFHPFAQSFACGSEANQVIQNFQGLKTSDKQDLLNFLRSL